MILMLLILLVARGNLANGKSLSPNKTIKLVEKIRRQLMEDNYDYFPSEEEVFPAHHEKEDGPNDPLYYNNDTLQESAERYNRAGSDPDDNNEHSNKTHDRADLFVPRARPSEEDLQPNDHAISRKDLFYYMDDDRLRVAENNDVAGSYDYDGAKVTSPKSPKVKYKVLKVKGQNPSRRSLSYRRFIQEENENGVAIISLDGLPFPQFHLPRSRRQYRDRDSGEPSGEGNATLADAIINR